MICPFCGVVVEQGKKHIDWHRKLSNWYTGSMSYEMIAPATGHPADDPPPCNTCFEPATWRHNEDVCCDTHVYTSTGYID